MNKRKIAIGVGFLGAASLAGAATIFHEQSWEITAKALNQLGPVWDFITQGINNFG